MFSRTQQTAVYSLVAFIVLGACIYGGYTAFCSYQAIRAEQNKAIAAAQLFAENKAKITEALAKVQGVSGKDITQGFWISVKNAQGGEDMVFIDPQHLASLNLTNAQLQDLVDRVSSSEISSGVTTRAVANADLPSTLQLHNALYRHDGTFVATQKQLVQAAASGSATAEQLFGAGYVAELTGDYAARDKLNAEECKKYGKRCATDMFTISVTGRVIDMKGNPVQGAVVVPVSRPEAKGVLTNAKGEFSLTFAVNELEKVRVVASKRNFSDGQTSLIVTTKNAKAYTAEDIQLSSPIQIVTIDTRNHTVTGAGNSVAATGFVVKTKNSTYNIPFNAIVHANGKPYSGTVDVYLYEFDKDTVPSSLTQIDTFDQVRGYAGNLMKSFGMPYIQFFVPGESKEELHVLRSNPMILTYTMPNMAALRAGTDPRLGGMTDADMSFLVKASAGQPYRIDSAFLIANGLLRFPAFWVYDRRAGVWDNVGMSVLSTLGTIQTIFYTINDKK